MKKKIISLFLILVLTLTPLFALTEKTTAQSSFFAPSMATVFTQDAIDAGRRVTTGYEFQLSEKALSFLDPSLSTFAQFCNQFTTKTTYQKNAEQNSFWSQNLLFKGKPLLSHSIHFLPDDFYLTSNLLPKESLAFTPKEAVTFLSNFLSIMSQLLKNSLEEQAQTLQLYAMIASMGASSVEKDTPWDELIPSSILEEINNTFAQTSLPKEELLYDGFLTWLADATVETPIISAGGNSLPGSTPMQFQFTEKNIHQFIDILKNWFTEEEVLQFFIAKDTTNSLAGYVNSEDFLEELEDEFEDFKEILSEKLHLPAVITLWYHENSQGETVIDQANGQLQVYNEIYRAKDFRTYYFEYNREIIEERIVHHIDLGMFDESARIKMAILAEPQHKVKDDEGHTQANLSFNITFENAENQRFVPQDTLLINLVQNQYMDRDNISSKETWDLDVEIESDSESPRAIFGVSGALHFKVVADTSLDSSNKDVVGSADYSLGFSDDFVDLFGSKSLFTVKKSFYSTAPKEDPLPTKEETTRLGLLTTEELTDWVGEKNSIIQSELSKIFSQFE